MIDGIDTGKINIETCKLNGARIAASHAKIYLRDIYLDSVNSISLGDGAVIDSFSGEGKLSLTPTYYPNRTVELNGKIIDQEFFIKVKLREVDPSNLILPDRGFHFIVDENQRFQSQTKLYRYLMDQYKDNPEQFQIYDIAYQKFMDKRNDRWLAAFIKEKWNNYGYDRELIFRNSMILMLLFFCINIFTFPGILNKGYTITEFQIAERLIRRSYRNPWAMELRRTLNCFFYTFFIFWGLKLSLDNIKIANIWYSTLIICQYIIGIICLAHIANIVMTR